MPPGVAEWQSDRRREFHTMIKNRQEVTQKVEMAVGEQNVCHEVFHVAWNCNELFHHGFPLTKNLHFTLTTITILALFSFLSMFWGNLLSVKWKPSPCVLSLICLPQARMICSKTNRINEQYHYTFTHHSLISRNCLVRSWNKICLTLNDVGSLPFYFEEIKKDLHSTNKLYLENPCPTSCSALGELLLLPPRIGNQVYIMPGT